MYFLEYLTFYLSMYDLMDPKVLQENYNTTENDVWQLVPAMSNQGPYFVICLIWTMPKEYHLSSDLNYEVSYCLIVSHFNVSRNTLKSLMIL